MEKLESILRNLEAVIMESDGEERAAMLSRLNSYIRVITNKYSEKVAAARSRNLRAAESSPNSRPARVRNIDTARLSRVSAKIVEKLGREPAPWDVVTVGAKTYMFADGGNGEVVVHTKTKGEDIRERVFTWKDGRLTRKNV